MAAVELPVNGIHCCRWASRCRQVDGEVAAFVRVRMQAAEAQLLVTKHSLGNADSRVALYPSGPRPPIESGATSTPGSAPSHSTTPQPHLQNHGQPEK